MIVFCLIKLISDTKSIQTSLNITKIKNHLLALFIAQKLQSNPARNCPNCFHLRNKIKWTYFRRIPTVSGGPLVDVTRSETVSRNLNQPPLLLSTVLMTCFSPL